MRPRAVDGAPSPTAQTIPPTDTPLPNWSGTLAPSPASSSVAPSGLKGSIAECVGKGAAIARLVVQGRQQGKNVSWNLGALPPNPRNLALSGQNSCWAWTTREALERRIGLRRNATRAPSQAPEWLGRLPSAPPI